MTRRTIIASAVGLLMAGLFVSGATRDDESRPVSPGIENADQPSGKLRLASCQFPTSDNLTENGEWVHRQMRLARDKGADLAHFAECALSGYPGADYENLDNLDWEHLRRETAKVLKLADELDLWVVLGSMHPLGDGLKPHNSLYVISPEGKIIDRYDKRFCTTIDVKHFSPGDHFVTFKVNGVTIGLLICYDIRFPELNREYAKRGTQLVLHSFYNARQGPGSIHPIIMPITSQARAASNYTFVSITNSSAPRAWPCHLITPDGLIADKAPVDVPAIIVNDVDTTKNYYDASKPFRLDCINGKLNSGETVEHARSADRTCY